MAESPSQQELTLAKIAADIVVAYVSRNQMEAGELPRLTKQIKAALMTHELPGEPQLGEDDPPATTPPAEAEPEPRQVPLPRQMGHAGRTPTRSAKPAVAVSKSVTPDHVVCLEDGKSFRSLKRHLRHEHGMTPEQYREKWGLPEHYPMVAPNYSAVRTDLAKKYGLGRRPTSRSRHEEETPRVAAE